MVNAFMEGRRAGQEGTEALVDVVKGGKGEGQGEMVQRLC